MATKHPKQPTDEAMKAKALSRWEGEGGAPVGGHRFKRPRDLKNLVDAATGEVEGRDPAPEESNRPTTDRPRNFVSGVG